MAKGGARKGAGRKKGGITKATMYRQEMYARAAADGISPLDVMIKTMRKAWAENNITEAMQAAVHAAPYMHPRLQATAVTLDDARNPEQFTEAELEIIVREGIARAAETEEGQEGSNPVH